MDGKQQGDAATLARLRQEQMQRERVLSAGAALRPRVCARSDVGCLCSISSRARVLGHALLDQVEVVTFTPSRGPSSRWVAGAAPARLARVSRSHAAVSMLVCFAAAYNRPGYLPPPASDASPPADSAPKRAAGAAQLDGGAPQESGHKKPRHS